MQNIELIEKYHIETQEELAEMPEGAWDGCDPGYSFERYQGTRLIKVVSDNGSTGMLSISTQ